MNTIDLLVFGSSVSLLLCAHTVRAIRHSFLFAKEELAVLAAETLGKLATPAAVAALELGARKGGAAVRHACAAALSHVQKQQRVNRSTTQTTNGERA